MSMGKNGKNTTCFFVFLFFFVLFFFFGGGGEVFLFFVFFAKKNFHGKFQNQRLEVKIYNHFCCCLLQF